MENVISLREKHILSGKLEQNIVCDLNDFSWFDRIDFRLEDGIVFTAGGLFYFFEKRQMQYAQIPMAVVGIIFGAANESIYYTEFAVRSFHIYLCTVVFACVNKAAFIFLQAMGKAAASTMFSMVREIVFGVGFALLLPYFYGLNGVLYSMPVSDILTFMISVVIIVSTYKQLSNMDAKKQDRAKKLTGKPA